jgi:hypothetical protein
MRGQKVTNQYNAGRDINFDAVQNTGDLIAALEHLKQQFSQAKEDHIISEEVATDADYQVTKAIQQAKKPDPDKKTILDYLNTAKELIGGIASMSSLVAVLVSATEVVQKLF